jgi:hypothetical protein
MPHPMTERGNGPPPAPGTHFDNTTLREPPVPPTETPAPAGVPDSAAATATAAPPAHEPMLAEGQYVNSARTYGAELPDVLVREIGAQLIETQLDIDVRPDGPRIRRLRWRRDTYTGSLYDLDMLGRAVTFLRQHCPGTVYVRMTADGPIVLTAFYEREGTPPTKARVRLAIAPRERDSADEEP